MRGRKDANQQSIVDALIHAHLSVVDLSNVPLNLPELSGLPDLLVGGYHQKQEKHINVLMEIKTADGKLRPDQENFIQWWRGKVYKVRTPSEALALFGIDYE